MEDRELLQKLVNYFDVEAKKQGINLEGKWNDIAKRYKAKRVDEVGFARATSFREAVQEFEPKLDIARATATPEFAALLRADAQPAEAGGTSHNGRTSSPSPPPMKRRADAHIIRQTCLKCSAEIFSSMIAVGRVLPTADIVSEVKTMAEEFEKYINEVI